MNALSTPEIPKEPKDNRRQVKRRPQNYFLGGEKSSPSHKHSKGSRAINNLLQVTLKTEKGQIPRNI